MLKVAKISKTKIDNTINEHQKHTFIEQKNLQAKKTLKKVGLPDNLKVKMI